MVVLDRDLREITIVEFECDAPGQLDRDAPVITTISCELVQTYIRRLPFDAKVI
jgi:hypothetical protein